MKLQKAIRAACVFLLGFSCAGPACTPQTIVPAVSQSDLPTPDGMDWSDWGLTLSYVVVGDRVDYHKLLERPESLDRFLHLAARIGPCARPAEFPDPRDPLVYAVNCYNAAILRGILEVARGSGIPQRVPADIETRFRFQIDGRLQSPADLRRTAESIAAADWRVRFALCDARAGSPPLWNRVFLTDLLDAQLDEVVRRALRSPQIVTIDHASANKRLRLWSGLYDLRDRLIREHEERFHGREVQFLSVLLEMSDRSDRERLNGAVGYPPAVLPMDEALNGRGNPPKPGLLSVFGSIRFIVPE